MELWEKLPSKGRTTIAAFGLWLGTKVLDLLWDAAATVFRLNLENLAQTKGIGDIFTQEDGVVPAAVDFVWWFGTQFVVVLGYVLDAATSYYVLAAIGGMAALAVWEFVADRQRRKGKHRQPRGISDRDVVLLDRVQELAGRITQHNIYDGDKRYILELVGLIESARHGYYYDRELYEAIDDLLHWCKIHIANKYKITNADEYKEIHSKIRNAALQINTLLRTTPSR